MPKVNWQTLSIVDWLKLADAVPDMIEVCQKLADLDIYGDHTLSPQGHVKLDEAQELARKALKKLEGR